MLAHKIVSRDDWLMARKVHLQREKELTRMRDRLSAERRELPWVKVEEEYVFDGPKGRETLAELFGEHGQLIIYHFMFGPGWEEGCPGCSFLCDHIDGADMHLKHHDVSVVAVSRAPYPEFQAFKKRMGWRFKWVSSYGSDFNHDFHVSFTEEEVAKGSIDYNYGTGEYAMTEMPGISVFFKDADGSIFHTYSSYARGGDILIGAYNFLDLTPKGRNETDIMEWVRHHDRYRRERATIEADACCHAAKQPA